MMNTCVSMFSLQRKMMNTCVSMFSLRRDAMIGRKVAVIFVMFNRKEAAMSG